ncbi:cell division protein FtsQ/DivIB [Streptomyces sp. NPDC001407]|uniref:cell division protein FtsQ/DivIB n=1 Tax=unclassified Streptomyces TaxID=2593676 RepID=UPI0033F6E475
MAGPTTAQRGGSKSKNAKSGRPVRSGPSRPAPGRPPRRRRILFWVIAATLVVAAAAWALYGSSWLRASRVDVSGARVLTPDEVRAAAEVPLGEPLISVDTDAIADRLREALPRIDTVSVERSWPRTIGLKVVERQPRAIVEKGGKFIEIDGTGVRFATVDHAPQGVPRLSLEAADSPSLRRFGTGRLEREGVRVAESLPAAVRADTRVIHVRSYDSITLDLTGGRTVVWGSGERGDAKARTLTALLKAARGADHFDVSAPSAPAASGS